MKIEQTHTLGINRSESNRISVGLASAADLPSIFQLRHQVYALELGQHPPNSSEMIRDAVDDYNVYLMVKRHEQLLGFISITPPGSPKFSIEKYLERSEHPEFDWQSIHELRLLTVCPAERHGSVAWTLLYAAGRWLQENGASVCLGMGRRQIMKLYRRIGFADLGVRIKSGEVEFLLMTVQRKSIDESIRRSEKGQRRMASQIDWNFDFPFEPHTGNDSCYHGGASIQLLGCDTEKIEAQTRVINADVLDAWFPVAPGAESALKDHLSWMVRTSPPTNAEEIRTKIAEHRGIPETSVVTGAGSSDLIFRALRHWLNRDSKVLLIKPCYAEYEYVCRNVIGCQVDQLDLEPTNRFCLEPDLLLSRLKAQVYDLVVVVNPNNPTGAFLPLEFWKSLLPDLPTGPRIWIDECYIDYVDSTQSMESMAATNSQIVICKSLSKCLALSGLRAGYLTLAPELANDLRRITPPWNLGTLTQLGISAALDDPEYYLRKYAETHLNRLWLECQLAERGFQIVPGTANFFLAHLPARIPDKLTFLKKCEEKRLFLRDTFPTSPELGPRTIRFAVKDQLTNQAMLEIVMQGISQSE